MVLWVSLTFKPQDAALVTELSTPAPVVTDQPWPSSILVSKETRAPSPSPLKVKDNRCIVTIDGNRYDVTMFRRKHEGGDVFKCGEDMSASFHKKHPSVFLKVLLPFKV